MKLKVLDFVIKLVLKIQNEDQLSVVKSRYQKPVF
jgi:hypothetical protein